MILYQKTRSRDIGNKKSKKEMLIITFAGDPITNDPSGMIFPSVTSELAPIKQFFPVDGYIVIMIITKSE